MGAFTVSFFLLPKVVVLVQLQIVTNSDFWLCVKVMMLKLLPYLSFL